MVGCVLVAAVNQLGPTIVNGSCDHIRLHSTLGLAFLTPNLHLALSLSTLCLALFRILTSPFAYVFTLGLALYTES